MAAAHAELDLWQAIWNGMSVKSGAARTGTGSAAASQPEVNQAQADQKRGVGPDPLTSGAAIPDEAASGTLTMQTWNTVQRRVFLWLSPVGALACTAAIVTQLGDMDPLDRYALPGLAAVMLCMFGTLALNVLNVTLATRVTFLANAAYLLLGLNHQFWQFVPRYEMLSEGSYWFAVLYATAFVAFRGKQAIQVCAAIFTCTVLICGVQTWMLWVPGNLSLTSRTVASVSQFLISSGMLVLMQYAVGNLRQQLDQVRAAAYLDVLTGLPNRRFAQQQLDALAQTGRSFSVVMIDIDHFKQVNDTYGHHAGDMVLRETGRVIGKHLTGKQFIARWGGEEFVLVLPGLHKREARALAETARRELYQHVFDQVGGLTASFGVAEWSGGDDLEAVMRRADAALYAAKRQGRNGVRVAMEDGRLTRLDLPDPAPPEAAFPVRAAAAGGAAVPPATGQPATVQAIPVQTAPDQAVQMLQASPSSPLQDELFGPGDLTRTP